MSDNDPYRAPGAELGAGPGDGPREVPTSRGIDWLTIAFRDYFAPQWLPWVLLTLAWLGINIVLSLVPVIGSIASALLTPVLIAGLLQACANQSRGEVVSVGALFSAFSGPHLTSLVLLGLLYLGAVVVVSIVAIVFGIGAVAGLAGVDDSGASIGIGVLFGVLLVLAALLPVVMAYWFAPALIVLNGLSVTDAIRQSFTGCLRNWLPFLVYGAVLLVLAIVAVIPLLLGLLVLMPVATASMYVSWREIYGPPDQPARVA